MFDKRAKMHGVQVSNEEVLQSLGHPIDWARAERRSEFRNKIKPGDKDLNIFGIKGCAGHRGYLDLLMAQLEKPPGCGHGLVSAKEEARVRKTVIREVTPKIKKYQVRLAKLEASPEAIKEYIEELEWWMRSFEQSIDPDPDAQPIEELQIAFREANERARRNIVLIQAEIEKYRTRLAE